MYTLPEWHTYLGAYGASLLDVLPLTAITVDSKTLLIPALLTQDTQPNKLCLSASVKGGSCCDAECLAAMIAFVSVKSLQYISCL